MKTLISAAIVACLATTAMAGDTGGLKMPNLASVKNPMVTGPTWDILKEDILDVPVPLNGEGLLDLSVPVKAFDASLVPVSIRQRRNTGERITAMKVVIDENPAPVAANFEFGPLMGDIYLESRVRYDAWSNIRLIAETESGKTFMMGRFVEAAGGCAGTASGDLSTAFNGIGKMKLRQFARRGNEPRASGTKRQVQVMMRHPNFTGMQAMPGTSDLIPARFVDKMEVYLGDEMLFRMTGGFSISQDPTFRFSYIDNGAQTLTVKATDTDGATFEQVFSLAEGA